MTFAICLSNHERLILKRPFRPGIFASSLLLLVLSRLPASRCTGAGFPLSIPEKAPHPWSWEFQAGRIPPPCFTASTASGMHGICNSM